MVSDAYTITDTNPIPPKMADTDGIDASLVIAIHNYGSNNHICACLHRSALNHAVILKYTL